MNKTASIIPLIRLPRNMGVFDYEIPDAMEICIGQLVHVPFRSKKIMGLVAGIQNASHDGPLKPISEVIHHVPFLPQQHIRLIEEMARVYGIAYGSAARMCMPPLQSRALSAVEMKPWNELTSGSSQTKLVQYYRARTLAQHLPSIVEGDVSTLIIVPRASDILELREVFPDALAWDSTLTQKKQRQAWIAARNGHRVIIGTRSAVFLPIPNLTHIVLIDEESEEHKNWDAQPRYRTYDIARRLQHVYGVDITLCSKTPRMSTLATVDPTHMTQIEHRPKTHLTIVDRAKEHLAKNFSPLSTPLSVAMERILHEGKSVCILSHKKGYAHALRCRDCGHVIVCESCGLPYRCSQQSLVCMHCHTNTQPPSQCPQCGSTALSFQSPGIEQLEQYCRDTFSGLAQVLTFISGDDASRLDATSPTIIICTKAALPVLPYEAIGVFGIIDCDLMLRLPEYDASEKALILLQELMCRADVHVQPPHIIIQTLNPHHPVYDALSGTALRVWYEQENDIRKTLALPPHSVLMKISIEHAHAHTIAESMTRTLTKLNPLSYNLQPERRGTLARAAVLIKLSPHAWWDQAQRITPHIPAEAIIDIDPISVIS